MKTISAEDHSRIEDAIRKAEAGTSGEIVVTVAEASAHYHHATLQGALAVMAAATAVFLLSPAANAVTGLLWTEFLSFAVSYSILPHLPWRRWMISRHEMDARVHEAAFMQFYHSGLYQTRQSNGVEIYVSFFERRVVVLGDRGIHDKMGEGHWHNVRDLIIRGMRRKDACGGICAAVESCGRALAEHFPPSPGDGNELPDEVIDRPLPPDAP